MPSWAKIKAAIGWLCDHWYLPIAVVGSALTYLVMRRGPTPTERVQVELDAVAAKRQVAQLALEQGAEAAHAQVAQAYAAHEAQMTQESRHAADQLQQDPPALAAYLVRLGARLALGDAAAGPDAAAAPRPAAADPKP